MTIRYRILQIRSFLIDLLCAVIVFVVPLSLLVL